MEHISAADWMWVLSITVFGWLIISIAIYDYLRKKSKQFQPPTPYNEKVIITAPREAFTPDEWKAMKEKFYLVVPYGNNSPRPPDVRIL